MLKNEDDISPWRQTQHDDIHQKQIISPFKSKASFQTTYLQFHNGSENGNRTKRTTLEPIIVMPQIIRSMSLRDSSLPKLSSKAENLLQRRGSFKNNQLQPLARSLSRADFNTNVTKKQCLLDPTAQQLRIKLEGLLKHQELSSPLKISRNLSQVQKGRNDIVVREKNIVFLYSPHSGLKKSMENPKKKGSNHILDQLLSDWK